MAARVGPDGEVTGVDPSSPVLDHARRRKPRPGSAPCTYREGIAESLDLPDASFDDLLEGLIADAGFEVSGQGEVRPWPARPSSGGTGRRSAVSSRAG